MHETVAKKYLALIQEIRAILSDATPSKTNDEISEKKEIERED